MVVEPAALLRISVLAPKKSTIVAGYLLAAILVGLIMTTVALIAAQVYIVASGEAAALAALLNCGLIVLSTIASSSLVLPNLLLKTPAFDYQYSSGTLAGFLMGIYVPVSVLPALFRLCRGLSHLHAAVLLRQYDGGPGGNICSALAAARFQEELGVIYKVGDYTLSPATRF